MTKTFSLAIVCCLAVAVLLQADAPPAAAPNDPAVAKLIEQLGDSDYRVRDDASRALRAAGPRALPALRQALAHPDAEVRRRARELLPVLESEAVLAPKRVTFETKDKPIKDAFDELTRQTGYHIEYNVNAPNQPYSFNFHDTPFWEAVDTVGRAAGLTLQQGYGDDHVRLYQGNGESPYVRYAGAFRFVATGFSQYRGIDFGPIGRPPQPRADNLTLQFSVFVEPKMAILGIGEPHLDAAYDDEKHSLLVPINSGDLFNGAVARVRFNGRYGNGNRMYSTQAQATLVRPSDGATTAKVIRGTLPVTLLVEQKEGVVTDKLLDAKGTKVQVGTTEFVIEDVTEMPGKQYQIRLSITNDQKGDPNDYSWINSLYQRLHVQDAKGNPMQVFQSNWNNQSANHVEMQMTYGTQPGVKADTPTKIVYETWVTRQEEVPFEFKDLPLP